ADDAPSCCEVPVEVVLDGDVLIGCRGEERFAGCGPLKAGDRVHLDGECRVEPGAMSAGLRLLQGLRLDLNRASEGDLELLDGVGPSLAQAIVEYRGEHGPFRAVDDLEKVNGIGPKTLAALRPYLDVAP
ncbi:MAG: ComEA family DNA-binding protein, partial [Myxococcota bacterium]